MAIGLQAVGASVDDAALLDRQYQSFAREDRGDDVRGVAPTFWPDADAGDKMLVYLTDGTREIWNFGTPPVLDRTIEPPITATDWQESGDAGSYGDEAKVHIDAAHNVTFDLQNEGESLAYTIPENPTGSITFPGDLYRIDELITAFPGERGLYEAVLRGGNTYIYPRSTTTNISGGTPRTDAEIETIAGELDDALFQTFNGDW